MPRTNKKYSPEFKILVVETKLTENLSARESAKRFDLYKNINGYPYPASDRVSSWEMIYLEEGKEGLYIEKEEKKKLDSKVEEYLIVKCQRLEMENDKSSIHQTW